MFVVVFLLVALLLVTGLHWYLWWRLVAGTTRRGSRARRIGTFTLVGAVVLLFATMIGSRTLPITVERVLAWPGYIWLAVMFYLLVTLLVLELPVLPVRLWLRRGRRSAGAPEPVVAGVAPGGAPGAARPAVAERAAGDDPADRDGRAAGDTPADCDDRGGPADRGGRDGVDERRRLLLGRSVAVVAGLAAAGAVGVGVPTALGPPVRRRVRIPLAKLPRRHDGLRIAVVSDIHLGPLLGRSHTARIVDTINGFDADVVAVVGDLVDGTVADLGPAAEPLAGLRSRLGGFFVTGNHEYFSGHEPWIEEISSLGLRVLRNARVELPGIDLAGVNDVTGGSYGDAPDHDRALAGRDPARPVVLLAHQPVQAPEAARRGVDLQLSGHTHGGQMWPFSALVRAQQPVVAGLGRVDGMPVYVTRGAGFWGPPVRLGAPPDVTLVELRAL